MGQAWYEGRRGCNDKRDECMGVERPAFERCGLELGNLNHVVAPCTEILLDVVPWSENLQATERMLPHFERIIGTREAAPHPFLEVARYFVEKQPDG